MSKQRNSTPTIEELQQEAVKILEQFNNPLEPFDTSMIWKAFVKILLDMQEQGNSALCGDHECFVIYKLLEITNQIKEWQKKAAIAKLTRETLS